MLVSADHQSQVWDSLLICWTFMMQIPVFSALQNVSHPYFTFAFPSLKAPKCTLAVSVWRIQSAKLSHDQRWWSRTGLNQDIPVCIHWWSKVDGKCLMPTWTFVFVSLLSIVSIHWNKLGLGGSKEEKWLWILPWSCSFDQMYRFCSFLSPSGFSWDHGRKENTLSTRGKEIFLFCFPLFPLLCFVLSQVKESPAYLCGF